MVISNRMHRRIYFTMKSWFTTNRRSNQFSDQLNFDHNMVHSQDSRTNNKGGRVTPVIKVQPITRLLDISQRNIIDHGQDMVQGNRLIKSPGDRKYLCVRTAVLNNMDQIGRALPSIRFASLVTDGGILLGFAVNQRGQRSMLRFEKHKKGAAGHKLMLVTDRQFRFHVT